MRAGRAERERERIKALIADAFAGVERPGNWALRGEEEGEEPNLVEQVFSGNTGWQSLDPDFLDKAPEGFATALNFLSDEAFRYFLPAYLIADLDDRLELVDPVFYLTHRVDDDAGGRPIDPARFGDRTWFDHRQHKFSIFTLAEAKAIVAYLEFRAHGDDFDRNRISRAIAAYWAPAQRAALRAPSRPSVAGPRPAEDRDRVKSLIVDAFAGLERPPDWALRGGNEGDEPYQVERAFASHDDWRTIDPAFLDAAPDGLSSALSFFSDTAFRYFLPAYLIADLEGRLERVDPTFILSGGLEDARMLDKVNPRRYGDRTWLDAKRYQFSVFTATQARAILAYLDYRMAHDDVGQKPTEQACRNYWRLRAESR